MPPTRVDAPHARWDSASRALFAIGLALSAIMIARVGVGFDAVDLLSRGWLLAEKGTWVPLGNPASGGGYVPGGLTALLVGAPLAVWMDHRSPIVLILVLHVVGYLLLDRVIKQALGSRARFVFALVFWLNPWRLFGATWLDNSNYGFVAGAVQLWACFRQREQPSAFHSAVLVAVVGLAGQVHLNALLLVFASVLLWWRGYWRPHWGGVALGTAITLGSLIPYFVELHHHPQVLPGREDPGHPGSDPIGLIRVWPLFKGVAYWFRYPSLWASTESIHAFDFSRSVGGIAGSALSKAYTGLGLGVAPLTVLIPLMANGAQWRRRRAVRRASRPSRVSPREWLREYTLWTFVACVAANALSHAPVMWWHNLVALQAAVLPVVLWTDGLLRTRRAAAVRSAMVAYLALCLVLLLGTAFGSEQHAGREPGTTWAPRHEMLRDLRIFEFETLPRPHWFFYREYLSPYEIRPPNGAPRLPKDGPDRSDYPGSRRSVGGDSPGSSGSRRPISIRSAGVCLRSM